MQQSVSFQARQPSWLMLPLAALILALAGLYLHLTAQHSGPLPLAVRLEKAIGIDAPPDIFEDAIAYALKNLAAELDIGLENYDISVEDYVAIVEATKQRFGKCQQYRLFPLKTGAYSCFTCTSSPKVILNPGQTFKIGQTCGNQKSRYGSRLPEPGLKYFEEFEGNIFEVLVAEYVKLILFKVSAERKVIIKNNRLSEKEMHIPPGNKILK